MEDWITIKNLKKRNPALGSRSIAELLGISRNTVKMALKSDDVPTYERHNKINPEIEPFREYIYERLVVKGLRGSRVLKEIISKGYNGSKSAFYRYIIEMKTEHKRTFQPYETSPAEQAQFDWSPYTILIGDNLTTVYVYGCILGFSRYRIYDASTSQTQGSVFEAMENSFNEIGGVTQRVQTDNAKCFVENPSKHNLKWNPRYLSFCGHYAIEPTRSLPGHPWSKGKVENPFSYLEEHFIKGNQFSSFEDFLKKLKTFQEEVNNRIHTSTGKAPKELLEIEKESLLGLPLSRYVGVHEESRKVTADCLISFNGNKYSVPYHFACKEVWIQVSRGYILKIYSQKNIQIAEHHIHLGKGKVIINKEHYKNHRIERGNFERLRTMFLEMFPDSEWFIEKIKTQKKINYTYHLTQILDIAKLYPSTDVLQSLQTALQYNTFSYTFIKGYLENHSVFIEKPSRVNCCSDDKKYLSQDIKRPLNYYKLKETLYEN